MPELTNFSGCSTTRVFYEPSRRVSVFWVVYSLPTPLFSFFLFHPLSNQLLVLAPSSTCLDIHMDQQRCPLFWRDVCQAYFTLNKPPYWARKVDLACIINTGLFGTHPLDSSINYFSDSLVILELFLWPAWHTGESLDLLVWFGCAWCDFGVWLSSFSEWNIPTGTTAPVSTSWSEPFYRMCSPYKSNPSVVENAEK